MTKSREKLLNRAKKEGLSEGKMAFLSREDLNLPEYFFAESYWFINKFSDEELDTKGYSLLEEIIYNTSRKGFKDAMYYALFYNSVDEIEKIFRLHKDCQYSFAFFRLLNLHLVTRFCVEDTICLAEKAAKEPDPAMYLYLCNFSYPGDDDRSIIYPKVNPDELHLYAKEGVKWANELARKGKTYFPEFDVRIKLQPFVKKQVPFSVAKKYEFDFNAYKNDKYETAFASFLNTPSIKNAKDNYGEQIFTEDKSGVIAAAESFVETSPLPVTMNFPCSIKKTFVSHNDSALKINVTHCDTVQAVKKADGATSVRVYNTSKYKKCDSYVVFYSDKITGLYQKLNRNNKLIPMGLKALFSIPEDIRAPLLQTLVDQGHIVFKDFLLHPANFAMAVPPIPVNELMGKHNLNEVFARYKNGWYFNWNKGNYQQYYVLMKAMDFVAEEDKRKIVACKDRLDEFNKENDFLFAEGFLCSYIKNNIEKNGTVLNDAEVIQIRDYIKMCRENKRKVKISFRSIKSLAREHNLEISLLSTGRNTLKVPKNSKFKPLRKLLPKEFVWIKNKNRLILEGREQGHCVASYADYITRDICAIYSVLYNDIRYTIEFCLDKNGEYYINQCQSKFAYIGHKDFDDAVLDYINGFLNRKVA